MTDPTAPLPDGPDTCPNCGFVVHLLATPAPLPDEELAAIIDSLPSWTADNGIKMVSRTGATAALRAERAARARVETAARRFVSAEDALADAHAAWPVHVGTYDEHLRVQHAAETEVVTAKAALRAALAPATGEGVSDD